MQLLKDFIVLHDLYNNDNVVLVRYDQISILAKKFDDDKEYTEIVVDNNMFLVKEKIGEILEKISKMKEI